MQNVISSCVSGEIQQCHAACANKISARARRRLAHVGDIRHYRCLYHFMVWRLPYLFRKNNPSGPFFIFFLTLFYQIINPIKALSTAFYNMQKGQLRPGPYQELMAVENTITEIPDAKAVKAFNSSIELRNVNFSYGNKEVLRNFNLIVDTRKDHCPGGCFGCGKEHTGRPYPRFHDVTLGEILPRWYQYQRL